MPLIQRFAVAALLIAAGLGRPAAPPAAIDSTRVTALLEALDADEFDTRQGADEELRGMGRAVVAYLQEEHLRTPSPEGVFTIANLVENPTWYGPTKVVAAGKGNPVGTRWMGLSAKGYGIHGTNAPRSIGKAASHGCIRMRNADILRLARLLPVGTPLRIF